MAIGLAFVDIVGDTSRTGAQIERDLNREIAFVEESIDEVQIDMALASGTADDLLRYVNADLEAVGNAAQAVNVNAELDPNTRARIQHQLQVVAQSLRGAREQIRIGVDEDQIVEETVAAVETAVEVAELVAPPIEIETTIDNDSLERAVRDFSGIGNAARGALGPVSSLGTGLLGFAGAAQGAFALVSTLKLVAPAAALAAPAILTVASAAGVLKLAMVGVEDAVTAALDPSDPEKFDEALKKLSPEAQKFAKQVQRLQPAFKDLQQSVQNEVFAGLDGVLKGLSTDVLPSVKTGLVGVAKQFNAMALSGASAASELGRNGMLGKALDGASKALGNLSDLPGVAVKALGQLAVAAGPAFDRLTKAAAGKLSDLGDQLTGAFESGNLEKAIDSAISQIGALFRTIGNLGTVFANVTSTAEGFNGVIGILERVSKALADITATDEAQRAFQALFGVLNTLTSQALPLLGTAFSALGGVIIALEPGVTAILKALGPALNQIIAALAPVLVSLAGAVSKLAIAFAPLITAAGTLIAAILPVLTPLFDSLARVFAAQAPLVQKFADLLTSFLVPILEKLPGILEPILGAYATLAEKLFPVAIELLGELAPAFETLQGALLDVFDALTPILTQIADLAGQLLTDLLPLLEPLIQLVGRLAGIFADELAQVLRTVVIPALRAVSQFIDGDFRGALGSVKDVLIGLVSEVARELFLLPYKVTQALGGLAGDMLRIGGDIIRSLIRGIQQEISHLGDVLGGVTDYIRDHKGPIEKDRTLLVGAGQAIMQGLIAGIQSQRGVLGSELTSVTGMIAGMSGGTVRPAVGSPFAIGGAGDQFAANAPQLSQQAPQILAQVFVGDREITDIVDTRVTLASNRAGRQLSFGTRR